MESGSSSVTLSPQALRERDLVSGVLRRDRKATAEFVSLCADSVHGYVYRRLSPRFDLVEDMVQEIFLDALESLPQFRGDSALIAWILAIARHKVQDFYRRQLRSLEIPDSGAEADAGFEGAVLRNLEHDRIQAVVDQLPEAYRIVLRWRYWENRSTAEMAAASGKTEKAIERLLARAREQFRRCYGE